jgi:biopolymer transport protein ExbB/TolQ
LERIHAAEGDTIDESRSGLYHVRGIKMNRILLGVLLMVVGLVAPVIGVGGTMIGMMQSFNEIAAAPDAPARPEALSRGVSTALIWSIVGGVVGLISFVSGIVLLVTSGRRPRGEPTRVS